MAYNYDIEIPDGYNITKLYSIVFTTGNFEPEDRTCSTCRSNTLYSSTDKDYIESKFKHLCSTIDKPSRMQSHKYYCWHTEDYASNQIIHAYSINESYLVEKIDEGENK